LLEETPLKVSNGIASVDGGEDFEWEDLSRYKIGVQRRCRVVMKQNIRLFERVTPGREAEVHQIFCSALDFSTVERCDLTIRIANAILEAEYRATILAACENARLFPKAPGARTLFLTLLGCGEFENPPEDVCDAILRCRDVIASSGLEIYLVCNGEREFKAAERLHGLAKELGGGVIETRPAEDEGDLALGECRCCTGLLACMIVLFVVIATALWFGFLYGRGFTDR
jgi:hypothetical protein